MADKIENMTVTSKTGEVGEWLYRFTTDKQNGNDVYRWDVFRPGLFLTVVREIRRKDTVAMVEEWTEAAVDTLTAMAAEEQMPDHIPRTPQTEWSKLGK